MYVRVPDFCSYVHLDGQASKEERMDPDRKSARVGIVAVGLGFTLIRGLACVSAPKPTSRYATPAAKTASLVEADGSAR